jgi:hypothetical protein
MAQVGRTVGFRRVAWDAVVRVRSTTLEALIGNHGVPVFCKLDVEGAEARVLKGLKTPIEALAFEYLPATRRTALKCLDYLERLGAYEYNWSAAETARLQPDWVTARAAADWIANLPLEGREGNLFARLR